MGTFSVVFVINFLHTNALQQVQFFNCLVYMLPGTIARALGTERAYLDFF